MAIDFTKRLGKKTVTDPHDPIKLYDTLDRKVDKGPLRPAQVTILTDWHSSRRTERDVVVKLHTGQGKTLIGLLLLQSKLNEGVGPAIYVCPNKFLANQTRVQAEQFGVAVCKDDGDLPHEFLESKAILVTHVQKLFNGHTQFKLGNKSLDVGSIVIDDAHACVDSIRDACIITIEKENGAYRKLCELFSSALESQGAGTFADIQNGNRDAILPVPYWAWQDKQAEIIAALNPIVQKPTNQKERPHGAWFVWPLLKDNLKHCQCIVSGMSIQITPYLPPLEMFGSYFKAKHRVFMSATVTNDSFLVRGLQLSPDVLRKPLTIPNEKWSGEKMVLLPSLIDYKLTREVIVNELGKPVARRSYGVVALTPSFPAAGFWEKCGATVAKTDSIETEIGKLKAGDCEKTLVFASRYDGIDLPDQMCRILVFDSTPHASNLADAYEEHCRSGSRISVLRLARSIEQGLGRSVRGEKDYSVVIVIGTELVRLIRSRETKDVFSAQTRMQIEIGQEIVEMAQSSKAGDPWKTLIEVVNQCLKRDQGWKDYYAEKMDQATTVSTADVTLDMFAMEMAAEQAAQGGDAATAINTIQKLIDAHVKDPSDCGWYLQEIARYAYENSKADSNKYQLSAHKKNRMVMRPANGMVVDKIALLSQKRVENVKSWIASKASYDELHLAVDDILGRLEFGTKADRFESAIQELGTALGFASQRPDKEWKAGPDNLWAVRDGEYFVIECKSEVDTARAEINKGESGQMNNACAWCETNYPGAATVNVMVIPTKKLSKASGFNKTVLILRMAGLRKFVGAARAFYQEFAKLDLNDLSLPKVQELLDAHKLTVEGIKAHLEQAVQL
jgi:replicative superfamily II helicase